MTGHSFDYSEARNQMYVQNMYLTLTPVILFLIIDLSSCQSAQRPATQPARNQSLASPSTNLAVSTNTNSSLPQPIINQQPNEVTYIDLKLRENLIKHQTIKYKQVERVIHSNPIGPSVVLRRGEPFNIVIHLRQTYDRNSDKIRLEFSFGPKPLLDKGTLIYMPVDKDYDLSNNTSKWNAKVSRVFSNQLSVQINLPPNMAIGIWNLKISTKLPGSKTIRTASIREALYVIFNPWNKDDAVHLPREDARQEYVLNEVGKIYIGSQSRPCGRTWNYGQFHEAVLPSVMQLLDKTRLDVNGRADVVRVSRAVSAMVNSHDDNGLLVGNWSGNYGDGLAPWQWTGSAAVFERYLQNGRRPVKFGQCWVFGGVTTTALRTLGIPTRTVSNFVSAHDTDSSLTVDKFYAASGELLNGINGDSIWNFHVWSDAWMARNDLPPGFGGWQAIDATPQEVSNGMYQLGPASLEAIKQGKVGFAYDVGFVFSEVNADLVHWMQDDRLPYRWRRTQIFKDHVGRSMLTKMIGALDERTRYGVADAEDVVNQYKHIEGSREERLAYSEAAKSAGLAPIFDNL